MNNIDFNQYKNRLRDYLLMHGIEADKPKNIKCFSPTHQDEKPSCQIFDDYFKCYACGIHGDIYDAVEILEGITERGKQFKHIQEVFGGSVDITQPIEKNKKEYKVNLIPEETTEKFENYLRKITNDTVIKNFLRERAKYTSNGTVAAFSDEIVTNLTKELFWWNGLTDAQNDGLSEDLLRAVGAIHTDKEGNLKKTFWHSGIIIKTGIGYKLHYYEFDKDADKFKCKKIASHGGKGFPCPNRPLPEKIVIVEGELKALTCQAAGLDNVFSIGGVTSLTKALINHFLLNSDVKEITIFFDNDTAGTTKAPDCADFLKKNGFTGTILFAKSDELKQYKDPDEAILFGHLDYVQNAIQQATLYQPVTETVTENKADTKSEDKRKNKTGKGNCSLKQIKGLLKLIPYNELQNHEKQPFISALVNAGKDYSQITSALISWGASTEEIPPVNEKVNLSILLQIARDHGVERHVITRLKQGLENSVDFNNVKISTLPIVEVDIEKVANTNDLRIFIENEGYKSEKETANLLEFYLKDKLIYVEELKEFYFFDGLIWNHRPDITDIAYNILKELALQFYDYDIYNARKTLDKLSQYKFCQTVMKALAEKPSIFRKQVSFDSTLIQETLTLQDGVLDFSGKQIVFRDAKPEEYRQKKLPYYVADCKKAGEPKHFMEFMNGNFDNKDTLNSLMYFLSLIPSRAAKFKIGGIFTGKPHTGKTTTMEIMSEIYPDMTVPIPRDLIMNSKYGNQTGGANPFLAQLEGAGAGISDETEKNDHLNSSMWKSLTGGGKLTARGLWQKPHNFVPTAQTIILTNYSPLFDKTDQAVIDRMLIIQFAKQHEKGEKGTMTIDELKEQLRPEFPIIVRTFAEYYIRLKNEYKSKIPQSLESEEYKKDYIENMDDNGLQNFVQKYIDFAKGSGKWVLLKEVYKRYCLFWNVELDENGKPVDPEKLTQAKFTRYLKRDYNEFKVKQMRVNGQPEQVVVDVILKDWNEVPEQNLTTAEIKTEPVATPKPAAKPTQQQLLQPPPEEDEENPFDDGPRYDIF